MLGQLVSGNLIVLLAQPGKGDFNKWKELTDLYPGDPPSVIWPEPSGAPGIITFAKKQRQIVIVENRLQIEARLANRDEVTGEFLNFIKKVLRSAGDQAVSAYGFNFDFACPGVPEVKELFNMSVRVSSFVYLSKASIKLSFQKDDLLFLLEITDGTPSTIHVNIHHNEATTTNDLVQRIEETLKSDWKHMDTLIMEVVGK